MTGRDTGAMGHDNGRRDLGRLTPTNRVEAFSDGVMAIAITLLVLELKVPVGSAHDHLLADLAARWPSYAAYVAAFLTIGIIWLNHHTLLAKIARFDARLHWLNLMLLFGVATLPFPTALLADYVNLGGDNAKVAAAAYGLVSTFMALPWGFMWRHLMDHPDLLEPEFNLASAQSELGRGWLGVPIYAAATVISLFLPLLALILYVAIAALYAITSQGWSARSPLADATDPSADVHMDGTP
jgi:uncharacterized membrane protein